MYITSLTFHIRGENKLTWPKLGSRSSIGPRDSRVNDGPSTNHLTKKNKKKAFYLLCPPLSKKKKCRMAHISNTEILGSCLFFFIFGK